MNIYLHRYNRLVAAFKMFSPSGYTENHHILPKCMGGDNSKENLVKFTAKAHYVAHHLLHKAFPENQKLANAFGMMLCGGGHQERRFSAKMYEQCRIALSVSKKGRKRPDLSERNRQGKGRTPWNKGIKTGPQKTPNSRKGTTLTEEAKKKISDGLKRAYADGSYVHPDVSEKSIQSLKDYHARKRIEGFTPEDIERKRKAGRARKGSVMSEVGRKSYSNAAKLRDQNAPLISCSSCGHTQKRSPNFYRYHGENCSH